MSNKNGEVLSRIDKIKTWMVLIKQNIIFRCFTYPKFVILTFRKKIMDKLCWLFGIKQDSQIFKDDLYLIISFLSLGLKTYSEMLKVIAAQQKINTKEVVELVANARATVTTELTCETDIQDEILRPVKAVITIENLVSNINRSQIVLSHEFQELPYELQVAIIQITDIDISLLDVDELEFYSKLFIDFATAYHDENMPTVKQTVQK